MAQIEDCSEIAGGYCYRFLVLFKRFMCLDLEDTCCIYKEFEDCIEFGDVFRAEFGELSNLRDLEVCNLLYNFREALYTRTAAKTAIKWLWQQRQHTVRARDGFNRLEQRDNMFRNSTGGLIESLKDDAPDAVHHYEVEFIRKFLRHFWCKSVGTSDQMLRCFQDQPDALLTQDALNLVAPSLTQPALARNFMHALI